MKQTAFSLGVLQSVATASNTDIINATLQKTATNVGGSKKSIFLYSPTKVWTSQQEIADAKKSGDTSQLPLVDNVMNFCYNTKGPGGVSMEPVQFATPFEEESLSVWGDITTTATAVIGRTSNVSSPFRWLSKDSTSSELEFSQWNGTSYPGRYANWAKAYPMESKNGAANPPAYRLCVRKVSTNAVEPNWQNYICDANYFLLYTRYILCQSVVTDPAPSPALVLGASAFRSSKVAGSTKSIHLYKLDYVWSKDDLKLAKKFGFTAGIPTAEHAANFCYNTAEPGTKTPMTPIRILGQSEHNVLQSWSNVLSNQETAWIGHSLHAPSGSTTYPFQWLDNKNTANPELEFSTWTGAPVEVNGNKTYTNWHRNFPKTTTNPHSNEYRLCAYAADDGKGTVCWHNDVCDGENAISRIRYVLCESA